MNSRAFGMAIMVFALSTPSLAGSFQATGQTTSYQADNNDGIPGPVDVPDDGALQRGKSLKYKVRKDGTIEDVRTGLIWEVKCGSCGGLHDWTNTYPWSGDGSTDTIWDWLDQVNAEGGKGYAGHHDWRIPNVRELQSIVDYGRSLPAIDPIFGPTYPNIHWSSTTANADTDNAWAVEFAYGLSLGGFPSTFDTTFHKDSTFWVRAVRGGQK